MAGDTVPTSAYSSCRPLISAFKMVHMDLSDTRRRHHDGSWTRLNSKKLSVSFLIGFPTVHISLQPTHLKCIALAGSVLQSTSQIHLSPRH